MHICITFIPLGDGSYLQKDLLGPGTFSAWKVSWAVFKVACLMLNPQRLQSVQTLVLRVHMEFWTERAHHPAAGWTASGGRGAPTVATEAAVLEVIQGGQIALHMEQEGGQSSSDTQTEGRLESAGLRQKGKSWRDTGLCNQWRRKECQRTQGQRKGQVKGPDRPGAML